jgi:hypothetical protein
MTRRPPITKDTKVAALLRDYPETEELLIGMSPAFAKLSLGGLLETSPNTRTRDGVVT